MRPNALELTGAPTGPLTLYMLQVQEDRVLAHKVAQQFRHVGDAMWDDSQPLPAHHVAPGKALGRGQGMSMSSQRPCSGFGTLGYELEAR